MKAYKFSRKCILSLHLPPSVKCVISIILTHSTSSLNLPTSSLAVAILAESSATSKAIEFEVAAEARIVEAERSPLFRQTSLTRHEERRSRSLICDSSTSILVVTCLWPGLSMKFVYLFPVQIIFHRHFSE